MQELTTDCANQLRYSRTEYDSATNPNICQFVSISGIRGLVDISHDVVAVAAAAAAAVVVVVIVVVVAAAASASSAVADDIMMIYYVKVVE